jgi:hypothetical protein
MNLPELRENVKEAERQERQAQRDHDLNLLQVQRQQCREEKTKVRTLMRELKSLQAQVDQDLRKLHPPLPVRPRDEDFPTEEETRAYQDAILAREEVLKVIRSDFFSLKQRRDAKHMELLRENARLEEMTLQERNLVNKLDTSGGITINSDGIFSI